MFWVLYQKHVSKMWMNAYRPPNFVECNYLCMLKYKRPPYLCRNFHYKDKTVLQDYCIYDGPAYNQILFIHHSDVMISTMASQITSLTSVYSTIFQAQIKEKIKAPETGEFPAQRASNAENISDWWRHHVQRGPFTGCEILI